MRRTVTRIITIFSILAGAFALSGCNTIEGAGKDIQAAGEEIEEAAES